MFCNGYYQSTQKESIPFEYYDMCVWIDIFFFDRVFARSRHRKTANSTNAGSGSNEAADSFDPYRSWSPLTEEGYAEKLRLLREAASVPMERWRAPTVLAWLEVALGMPQYGPRCAENVKSGKVKDSSICSVPPALKLFNLLIRGRSPLESFEFTRD